MPSRKDSLQGDSMQVEMMNFYERYDLSEAEGMHYNLSKLKNRQKHGLHQIQDEE